MEPDNRFLPTTANLNSFPPRPPAQYQLHTVMHVRVGPFTKSFPASRLPGFPASREGSVVPWQTFKGLALIWSKETGDRWWCRTPLCISPIFSCHLLLSNLLLSHLLVPLLVPWERYLRPLNFLYSILYVGRDRSSPPLHKGTTLPVETRPSSWRRRWSHIVLTASDCVL